jgi:hypothetical protein
MSARSPWPVGAAGINFEAKPPNIPTTVRSVERSRDESRHVGSRNTANGARTGVPPMDFKQREMLSG